MAGWIARNSMDRSIPAETPRRRPYITVPDEHAVGIESHLRITQAEAFGRIPKRGRTPAIEQAGFSEKKPEQTLAARRQLSSSSRATTTMAISPRMAMADHLIRFRKSGATTRQASS
jgi:hypothetical protein